MRAPREDFAASGEKAARSGGRKWLYKVVISMHTSERGTRVKPQSVVMLLQHGRSCDIMNGRRARRQGGVVASSSACRTMLAVIREIVLGMDRVVFGGGENISPTHLVCEAT